MGHLVKRYRLHGLTVHSEVALEAEQAPPGAAADVVVLLGDERDVPPEVPSGRRVAVLDLDGAGLRHAVVALDGAGWLMRFPGAAEVEVDADLRRASVHLAPGFPVELAGVLVAGFVMATLLQLRGDPVLHASAVEVDGAAVAVVGPSGTGKSTTATLLCRAGGRLVTDDVLRLSFAADGPVTWRGPSSTRLRDRAAVLAAEGAPRAADGRTVARLERASRDGLPLGVVVLPRPRRDLVPADTVTAVSLTGARALTALLAAPRILGWCDAPSLAQQMQQLSSLVRSVPVVEVHMPWGPPFPAQLGPRVIEAVRQVRGDTSHGIS